MAAPSIPPSTAASTPAPNVPQNAHAGDIDLFDMLESLWQRRLLIVLVTLAFALGGTAYAFLATPVYRAEVVLAATTTGRTRNIPGQLGGLASLIGIDPNNSSDATEAVATLKSRAFLSEFIADRDLLPILFARKWDAKAKRWFTDDPEDAPDVRDGVKLFSEKVRTVTQDTKTGLVTIAIEWTDSQLAAAWADELVRRINEQMRTRALAASQRRIEYLNGQLEKASLVELRQAISRLIENEIQTVMLAQADSEYAFKIIDPPRAPKKPFEPRKGLTIVVSSVGGLLLGVLAALMNLAARRRRTGGSQM